MTDNESQGAVAVDYADLSAFQRDVLVVLERLAASEEDSYGLAVKRRLENRYGENVNHGRLYPNLDELVDMELVERGEIDKRTNRYTVTGRGREVLADHAEEMAALMNGELA